MSVRVQAAHSFWHRITGIRSRCSQTLFDPDTHVSGSNSQVLEFP